MPEDDGAGCVWPPRDGGFVDEELEAILVEAMSEAQREAHAMAGEGAGDAGVDVGAEAETEKEKGKEKEKGAEAAAEGPSLISLMDDDVWVDGGNAGNAGNVEPGRDIFDGLLLGGEGEEEEEERAVVEPTVASDHDPTGIPSGAPVSSPPVASVPVPDIAPTVPIVDDLSSLFALDESEPVESRPPAPTPPTPVVAGHEKKALDMMTGLLDDFDISSSIAKSVSPRSRVGASQNAGGSRPMRAPP